MRFSAVRCTVIVFWAIAQTSFVIGPGHVDGGDTAGLVASVEPRQTGGQSLGSIGSTADFKSFSGCFKSNADRERFSSVVGKLSKVADRYDEWGLTRTTRHFGEFEDLSHEDVMGTDWASQTCDLDYHENFLRQGLCYRAERLSPEHRRMRCCFDGTLARIRSPFGLINGPERAVVGAFEESFRLSCPHTAIISASLGPSIEWLFSPDLAERMFTNRFALGPITVKQGDIDGHSCYQVQWRTIAERDGHLIHCDVSFAKDRDLLPIREQFKTSVSASAREIRTATTTSFQQDSRGRWFPQQVMVSTNYGKLAHVSQLSFDLNRQFQDRSVYSDGSALLAVHENPPPALVKPYASPELLTTEPERGFQSGHTLLADQGHVLVMIIASVLISSGLVVWGMWRTRTGAAFRHACDEHRVIVGLVGIVATGAFGGLCSVPPGWTTFGVASICSGAFGLGWILLQMLLFGETKVSLRTTFCAATAFAILIAGYSMGFKRMKVRDRMLDEIRYSGGQVVVGLWHLDEEGLFLPAPLAEFFGEAWTGRARRAAVEATSFRGPNVERWCMEELRWLGVASEMNTDFQVDADALQAIGDDAMMWTFHADNGYLDDDGMSELSRFASLVDLHFDCQQKPVSERIGELKNLERVWLTDPIVDDQLFDRLSRAPRLDSVYLINPEFSVEPLRPVERKFKTVEIRHASIDHEDMQKLGKIPTSLAFVHCKFDFAKTHTPVGMDRTRTLVVHGCGMDDESLVAMGDSPQLTWFHLGETNVTVRGIEAFSKAHPSIPITLE
ncbi:hypothetical protein [Roseiconus lacunae]|uniref:hypothetical protein n=1 Tax=Roseiconus lacunae TaxID=2605694 RepID=UPI001E3ECA34|nr:hypothetical protein [Roseiconus lacunae]MCD0461209.1 hypothetical protein [Roseiconus lacunae]